MSNSLPIPATAIYLDGLNGVDTNDGHSPSVPVKTYTRAKTLVEALSGDKVLVYKNMRGSSLQWNINSLQMLLWDTTQPCPRGDTDFPVAWVVDSGNCYVNSVTIPGLPTIGCIVVDWSTTTNSWGAHPAHLIQVADQATCRTTNNSYFQTGGTVYVNLGGDNPNAHSISFTEHRTSGGECNGIDITGNNNVIEAWPALWTEGGGSGNGSNGKGGWGVILRGDTGNRIVLYGANDWGYKAAAVVGSSCVIEGAPVGCTLSGFANHASQGVSANGNAGITGQTGAISDANAMNIQNMVIHSHSLLQRGTGTPMHTALAGPYNAILCHGQGPLITGLVISGITFYNDFDQDLDYVYAGNLGTVSVPAKTAGIGHPCIIRHCRYVDVRRINVFQHCWFDGNTIFATKGVNRTAVFETVGGSPSLIITLTGNLCVYSSPQGGAGIGLAFAVTAGMEIYSIGNTYVNLYTTNSYQAVAKNFDASSIFYSRQDIVHMPVGSYGDITQKGVYTGVVGTLNIEYMYCVGVGALDAAVTSFTLPANFDATHAASGTCQAYTDAAATTCFVNPSTSETQTDLSNDYHIKSNAPAALRALNLITPHMYNSPDGRPYVGAFGAYQPLGSTPITPTRKGLLLDIL